MKLEIEPSSVTIGEIVRKLEDRHAIVECFRADGGECTLTPKCRLKGKLASAREAFLRELDATTLEDCAYPASFAEASSRSNA